MNYTCLQQKLVLIYRPRRDGRLSWPWVAGWLHTEISVRHRELNPDTVAHLSTNRARRRLTQVIVLWEWTCLCGILLYASMTWEHRVVRCPSVNIYSAWQHISVISGGISMNLGSVIQHVSGYWCKDFQGHEVKGRGHRTTATEISCMRLLANRWRGLNQNLNK